jgi:competence protein ComEC
VPTLKAAAVAGFVAAFGYALLAGFAVPAQRTVLMILVVAAAVLRGVELAPSTVLALALFVVTLFDPWAVTAPGFWLSFGAVAVILYVTSGQIRRPHWLAAWGRVQWAVTLGLVPLLLALFQQVSVASPVANAVAIPVVSFVVVPLTLLGCVPPLGFLLPVAELVLDLCMRVLTVLSASGAAVWQSHAPQPWAVALALTGVAWLLLPRGFPARWVGLVAFVPLFAARPDPVEQGALRLTVLDVGQGLAVVAQTRHHALLYDTGPDFSGDADAGKRIAVPFLRASGVTRLDGVVLSHDDIDHIGGAASVLQALPVGWVATSLPDDHPLRVGDTRFLPCADGQQWNWDGVRFEMLSPRAGDTSSKRHDNDRSCVLKITSTSGSVLIPGDIEGRAEAELVARAGDRVETTFLIAPHHGSQTSSSDALLDGVKPSAVAFTAGYHNRFGHPKAEVVERYQARNVETLRSDQDGALIVNFANGTMKIVRWRNMEPRYWRDMAG